MKKIYLFLLLSLTSCAVILPHNPIREYRKSLTDAELLELHHKGMITKNFRSKPQFQQISSGKLNVQLINGEYYFRPIGSWESFYKTGELSGILEHDSIGQIVYWQLIDKLNSSTRAVELYYFDEIDAESNVQRIERGINYASPDYLDTTFITRSVFNGKDYVLDGIQKTYTYPNGRKTITTDLYKNGRKLRQ